MAASDQLVSSIAQGVLEAIKPYIQQQTKVINEEELMQILGVKDKSAMAAYRQRGLKGHRIDHRHMVYFWDDVENFIRSEGMEW